jgi:hypothetical protein
LALKTPAAIKSNEGISLELLFVLPAFDTAAKGDETIALQLLPNYY